MKFACIFVSCFITISRERSADHAKAVVLNQLANQTEVTYQLLDKYHAQYGQLKSRTRALRFEDVTLQLAAYRIAACSLCRLESSRVSAKLLFVGADVVREL